MLNTIELANASEADLPGLCDLLAQLFAQEREFSPNRSLQEQGLRAILDNPTLGEILLARDAGRAVAMVVLLYTLSTALGGRVAWLEDMVVDENYRGERIGGRLLEFAIAHARAQGCMRLTLLTDGDNRAAQGFYAKQGFQISMMQPMRLLLASED